LVAWLDSLDPSELPDGRVLIEPIQTAEVLDRIFVSSHTPQHAMRDAFTNDVAHLVQSFSQLTDSALVDLRLEAITHDHCWRFHRDNVQWRLLTTYLGPGTECVERRNAERALAEQRDYAGPLKRLPRFAIALFRGLIAGEDLAVLHRSPAMRVRRGAQVSQTRLLLCLNLPSAASPPPWG